MGVYVLDLGFGLGVGGRNGREAAPWPEFGSCNVEWIDEIGGYMGMMETRMEATMVI